MKYIASCSGGGESTATLILAKELKLPLDEVVYCEVMFDNETSGEHPEHSEFIETKLKPFVEKQLQVPFTHLKSDRTYIDCFEHKVTRGEHIGKTRGFPIAGLCFVNRDCKIPPIRKYWKAQADEVTQYIGIASDEPVRLARLHGTNRESILERAGMTQVDAKLLCASYGLLSPVYDFTNRNGCWFCMNCKDSEWRRLLMAHEALFDRLIQLENEHPERYRTNLTRKETPSQLKRRLLNTPTQYSLFDTQERK